MSLKTKRRKCRCCSEFFFPDYRNQDRQLYCGKPACQQASQRASQRRWLAKPANRHYFRDTQNVQRVRDWRKAHPGYWKRAKKSSSTLQDFVPAQALAPQPVPPTTSPAPLQDLFAMQDPLLLGVISHLIDSPLQDHVEQATLRLLAKGRTILDLRSGVKSNTKLL